MKNIAKSLNWPSITTHITFRMQIKKNRIKIRSQYFYVISSYLLSQIVNPIKKKNTRICNFECRASTRPCLCHARHTALVSPHIIYTKKCLNILMSFSFCPHPVSTPHHLSHNWFCRLRPRHRRL